MTHFDNGERVSNQAGYQHIEGNLNIYATPNADSGSKDDSHSDCLSNLRVTPPRVDRARILAEKDDLLEGSCSWVLDDPAFREWWSDDKTRILWIHGDPGKGKTMMAMSLIEEITKLIESGPHPTGTLAYFFCQNTVDRLSNAATVVRSLIYLLVEQQRSLTQYVRTQLKVMGSCLFEGDGALYALWTLLLGLLEDPALPRIYLLVDAVDECTRQQVELLELVAGRSMASLSKVKWLVTSRNEPVIKERLEQGDRRVHTSLELNSRHISRAVTRFVKFKVAKLVQMKKYDYQLRLFVDAYLQDKANGTFLWVALVCRELQKVSSRKAKSVLEKFPSGLQPLYLRMMEQILSLADVEDVELCSSILRAVTVAVRPLHISELVFVAGLPGQMHDDLPSVLDLISQCGSFLTLREEVVSFVHQSAKDFLSIGRGTNIFPSGLSHDHSAIARRCRELISSTLKKDICDLKAPGIVISKVAQGLVARCLPAPVQYACCHWASHLIQSWGYDAGSMSPCDREEMRGFFSQAFLHWVEALSLIGKIAEGVAMVIELESIIQPEHDTWLAAFLYDAHRFIHSHRSMLEMAPLQIYSAGLLFSPKESVIRQMFADDVPHWIKVLGASEERWSACLQMLEGHSRLVTTVVFSPDGQLVASGSNDCTVRLWDARTGSARGTLEGHSSWVTTVVFSPDGQLVASGSDDDTVRLWDARTGTARGILEGHSGRVTTVLFSPDGQLVASGSDDHTVRLWDAGTGTARGILEGHSDEVTTVVFSPDGQLVASGSDDRTVRLWDAKTGTALDTLKGHSGGVTTVVFSPDGQLVASGSDDRTVRQWDARTGSARGTLEGHSRWVTTVVFSPDGQLVASGSHDHTVRLWDARTGSAHGTLEGHSGWVNMVVFSPDGQLVASGSNDCTVRLWDARTGSARRTLNGHSGWVTTVVFSPDGQLVASGSDDGTVRLWDARTGSARGTLEGHSGWVTTVVFSPDGRLVASGSNDCTVRLWDARTGSTRRTLNGHSRWVTTVVFSPDGRLVASGSNDRTVRLWDAGTGSGRGILEGHSDEVTTVVFSPDGQLVASGSDDRTVRLWDARTGSARGILEGHFGWVDKVVFSPDGQLVVSGSDDDTVRLWDARTCSVRRTLKGHSDYVTTVVFSPDGRLVASGSVDGTVRLWDARTGVARGILEGHSDRVSTVVFSPDGQLVASGSRDRTVRLWNIKKKETIRITEYLWKDMPSFSPDSSRLTVGAKEIDIGSSTSSTLPPERGQTLRLHVTGAWISSATGKILWLPLDRRPEVHEIRDTVVVLGAPSGIMTFLSFNADSNLCT